MAMYVCQLSRLKFSAPGMLMYFYCIYTNIYSISYMMSSWSLCWLCHNLSQLPMHSMDVYTLIILVKFQNFYTSISPPTVTSYGSNWKSWQDTSRHHWDFYSLAPGSKLTWYKSSHYRAKSPFSVQILKLLTAWFQNSYIFRPLDSVSFSPLPQFYSSLTFFSQLF